MYSCMMRYNSILRWGCHTHLFERDGDAPSTFVKENMIQHIIIYLQASPLPPAPPMQAFKISGIVKITFPLRLEVFQLWVPFWMLCCSPKCHQSGNVENVGGPGRENGNYCWMADWLLAAWNLPRFGNIFGAFLRYFGVTGHHFGTTEHHFGITGHHFAPCGANVSILDDFW